MARTFQSAYIVIKQAKGTQRISNILPTATPEKIMELKNVVEPLKYYAFEPQVSMFRETTLISL